MSRSAKLGSISPFFIVKEIERAIGFYSNSLGFEVKLSVPNEEPFFAIVGRDQVQILLKEIAPEIHPQPNPSRHPWARWDAFVFVEDPDAFAAELRGRAVDFHEELKNWEDGLRGFAVKDRDGYVIFFGRPL